MEPTWIPTGIPIAFPAEGTEMNESTNFAALIVLIALSSFVFCVAIFYGRRECCGDDETRKRRKNSQPLYSARYAESGDEFEEKEKEERHSSIRSRPIPNGTNGRTPDTATWGNEIERRRLNHAPECECPSHVAQQSSIAMELSPRHIQGIAMESGQSATDGGWAE